MSYSVTAAWLFTRELTSCDWRLKNAKKHRHVIITPVRLSWRINTRNAVLEEEKCIMVLDILFPVLRSFSFLVCFQIMRQIYCFIHASLHLICFSATLQICFFLILSLYLPRFLLRPQTFYPLLSVHIISSKMFVFLLQ